MYPGSPTAILFEVCLRVSPFFIMLKVYHRIQFLEAPLSAKWWQRLPGYMSPMDTMAHHSVHSPVFFRVGV